MANNFKRNIFHYGDKIIFGVFLIIFVAVAMMSYLRQRLPEDEIIPSPGKVKAENRELFAKLRDILAGFETPEVPSDYITGGFATDPDKIEPIPGEEKQCERCGYIVPIMTKKCPACGYLFEDDDDDDGMDNTWEDKYLCVDRYTPDANKDPDKDRFTNIEEYLGGSDPCDPKSIPSPFKIVKKEQRPVDILFKGYIVREGGNPNAPPEPLYWDLQINWGRNTKTKILPLGSHFHGYHLYPLERRKEIIQVVGGPPYEKFVYYLTIQKPGKNPIILKEGEEAREQEYYIALELIRGPDTGKPFDELYEADEITIRLSGSPVIKETFRIITIDDEKVVLRDSKGKIYRLY